MKNVSLSESISCFEIENRDECVVVYINSNGAVRCSPLSLTRSIADTDLLYIFNMRTGERCNCEFTRDGERLTGIKDGAFQFEKAEKKPAGMVFNPDMAFISKGTISDEARKKITAILEDDLEKQKKPVPLPRQPVGKRFDPKEYVPKDCRTVLLRQYGSTAYRNIYPACLDSLAGWRVREGLIIPETFTWEELPE